MKASIMKLLILTWIAIFSNAASAGYIALNGWGVNLYGTGADDAVALDLINVSGNSYNNTSTVDGAGLVPATFQNAGYLISNQGTSTESGLLDPTVSLGGTLTALFDDWAGHYTGIDSTGATFAFDSGTVKWYAPKADGTYDTTVDFLTANILSGTGDFAFFDTGTGLATGAVNIIFGVEKVLAGYVFIDVNEDGDFTANEDLATLLADAGDLEGDDLYYSFGLANSTNTLVEENNIDDVLSNIAILTGVSPNPADPDTNFDIVTRNTGTYQMAVVPEPGMLSLMGLAFLGLAGFQRRRKSQQS